MKAPKALLEFEGQSLVRHLVRIYYAVGCTPVIVVVGGRWADHIRAEATSLPGVLVLTNPDPARGMLSSLQVGLSAAQDAATKATLFGPVDLPLAGSETVAALLQARTPGADLVVARWEGRSGHPVVVGPKASRALLDASPDVTARDVLQGFDAIWAETGDPGVCTNLNTPEDAAAWRERMEDRE